jgi:hypothetical protein
MIEVAISIVAIFAFVSGDLVVWRFMRGPAQQRPGLTLRIAILSLIGILLVSTSAWKLGKSRTFQFFGGIVPRVDTVVPVVAEKTDQLIRATGYEGDIHFRSPYGKKLVLLPYYLSRTGRLNIFMDVEPESYTEIAADADRIVEHVLTKTRPGSIILLHVMAESRTESRRAIPGIIQGLKEQGYSFVTVSELHAMP